MYGTSSRQSAGKGSSRVLLALSALGVLACVAVLSSKFERFKDRLQFENAVLQDLATYLDGPIVVRRGSGFWIGRWEYRVASYVDLPEVSSDEVEKVAEALNKLKSLQVVIVRRSQLAEDDEERLRAQLPSEVILSEALKDQRDWHVFRPRAQF